MHFLEPHGTVELYGFDHGAMQPQSIAVAHTAPSRNATFEFVDAFFFEAAECAAADAARNRAPDRFDVRY